MKSASSLRVTAMVALVLMCDGWLQLSPDSRLAASTPAPFTRVLIEADASPWGKALIDLDRDGQLDIVAAFPEGGVYWYHASDWTKYYIGDGGSNDLQAADMNGDGAIDVVSSGPSVVWYQNPLGSGGDARTDTWSPHVIDYADSHDVLVADINADAKLDVAVRMEFGPTFIYFQDNADSWTKVGLTDADDGNALAVVDVDGDGRLDIVENGYWLQQPDDPINGDWSRHDFATWIGACSVMVADMNHDGRPDVILSPSESAGRISWFEKPADPAHEEWVEHVVLDPVSYVHRIRVGDFNGDGNADIAFAEMDQSETNRVAINFANDAVGASWTLQVLAATAGHNIAIGDVEGDGDLDILNANWRNSDLELWRNDGNSSLATSKWQYIEIDDSKPDQSFGLTFADLNRDGFPDIVTGREWYRNPGGDLTGQWVRTDLAASYDAMLALDVGNTGQPGLIAQLNNGENQDIYWLQPTTSAAAEFASTLVGSIPTSRDYASQGYALANINGGRAPQLIFSSDFGDYYFTVPDDPAASNWPRVQINSNATQEGIAAADMNSDGAIDVVGSAHSGASDPGTLVAWWQNPGNGNGNWAQHVVGNTKLETDRIRTADINGDGRPDVVVTDSDYYNWTGNVYWFEQRAGGTWVRHTIAANLPAAVPSLDVGDFNKDGTIDIVIGEHGGNSILQTIIFESPDGGASWNSRLVDTNKESHQGTQVVDLDNDTDLDIVSIAYNAFNQVHLWRNDAIVLDPGTDTSAPTVVTPATATPDPVTGTTTTLSVLGADDNGEANLTYTWTTAGTPPAPVSFSANGTNAAKTVVATFSTAGSYVFQVTVRDASQLSVTSSVTVTVTPPPIVVEPPAPIAHVQSTSTTADASALAIAEPFAFATTASNLIVAAVSWGSSATLSCADTQGNSYLVATTRFDPTNNQSLAICYAANVKGGPTTVTATFSGSAAYRRLAVHEYSGLATDSPLDGIASNLAAATTAPNGVTSTPALTTHDGDLLFGAVMDDANVTTIAAGTGFLARQHLNNTDLVTEDRVQAIAGPAAATFTFGAADRYLAQLVAFKARTDALDTASVVGAGDTAQDR